VLKWLLTLVLALVLLSALTPLLARFGLGRLPGDLSVRLNGRSYVVPITSTVLLSAALATIVWMLT